MTGRTSVGMVTIAWLLAVCPPAGAQTSGQAVETPSVAPGWTLVPSATVAVLWDSNVALTSREAPAVEDLVTAVGPGLAARYRGRRTQLSLDYRGTYDLYREHSQFDAADHRGRLDLERVLTRRVGLFARNAFSLSPTTELPGAEAGLIVLRRRTTRFNDFRGGLEIGRDGRTSLTAAYASQWVSLAGEDELQPLLRGGHSHGGDLDLRHRISDRASVGGTYRLQHAIVSEGQEAFDIQHAAVLVDLRATRSLTVAASAGYAWLLAGRGQAAQSAPAYSVGLTYARRRTSWELAYLQAFLPSFGFGGTVQNKEVRGSLHVPLGRRLRLSTTMSARENVPLAGVEPALQSLAAETALLVTAASWLQLDLFASHTLQDAQRPGGRVNRTRAGIRLTTLTSARLR